MLRPKILRRRLVLSSRAAAEIIEQFGDEVFELFAMADQVDQAVVQQELAGLKTLRQLLLGGFLDHPRPGKPDERLGLGDDYVAERRVAGHHTGGGGMRKHRKV